MRASARDVRAALAESAVRLALAIIEGEADPCGIPTEDSLALQIVDEATARLRELLGDPEYHDALQVMYTVVRRNAKYPLSDLLSVITSGEGDCGPLAARILLAALSMDCDALREWLGIHREEWREKLRECLGV